MANEVGRAEGAPVALQAATSGASVATGGMSAAASAGITSSNNVIAAGLPAPDAIFAVRLNFTVAPAANKSVDIVARPKNFDAAGTATAPAPTATYVERVIGSVRPDAATGTQTLYAECYDIPPECDIYLFNNGTGQAFTWGIDYTPASLKSA